MTDTYVVDADSGKSTILKDPDAILDYTFDWTLWLDDVSDTISSKTITVQAIAGDATPLACNSSSIVGKTVVTWLGAGAAGKTYKVTCDIVTAASRKDDRSFYVKVKDR